MKQVQRLTPMQVRLVRMLEMTGQELDDEINRALDEMPALTVENDDESLAGEDDFYHETAEDLQRADYPDGDEMSPYRLEAHNHSADDSHYMPLAVNDEPTLYEHLIDQLNQSNIDERLKDAALMIIGNLDDNGYLSRSVERIADDLSVEKGIDVPVDVVNEALTFIRGLDPAGIAANDLRETLLLQLERLPDNERIDLAKKIVETQFDLLSLKHYDILAKRLGVDENQLRDAIEVIRGLNPKPGAAAGSTMADSANRIIPEISVDTEGDNVTVSMLTHIPRLGLSETFKASKPLDEIVGSRNREDANAFLKLHRDEATQFITALAMRQKTLMQVMKAIVALQLEFFKTGDSRHLRPMVLRDVAKATGLDASTVSRATQSKYVLTQWGVYPLKFFFNERSPASGDGDDISAVQLNDLISRFIKSEDKRRPLTDSRIGQMLADRGLNVARRTVAKYRERLGYPIARLRREL